MKIIGPKNKGLLDEWSFVHLAGGVLMAQTNLSFAYFLALHTAFEIIENMDQGHGYLSRFGLERTGGDTLANVIGDTLSATAGWYMAKAAQRGE
mgnify:CR=1 FL=1|jgi:hypothetical protein